MFNFTGRAIARAVVLFMGLFLLAACQTTSFYQSETLRQSNEPLSVVVMPGDIKLVELTAGGLEEPNAQWTADATRHIEVGLREQFAEMGLEYRVVDPATLTDAQAEAEQELINLHSAVGSAIILHSFLPNLKLPVKGDTFDWTLGDQVTVLRDVTGADYALFMFVKDQYSSPGRVAVQVVAAILGVGVQGGQQIAYATLVDLRTGDVVWFNLLARGTGDLRTLEPAKETVKELLNNFPSTGAGTGGAG